MKKKYISPVLIIVLPLFIIIDFIYYWMTRSSCLQCNDITYFLKTYSLSFVVLSSVGYHIKLALSTRKDFFKRRR